MTLLKAEAPIYGGYSISRADGVIFIRGAVPGEVVEVNVEERKRDYSVASVSEVVEPSPHRVEPPCQYFGDCGGCQLQYVSYDRQVTMKNEILKDCLVRIGKIEIQTASPLFGDDYHYRIRGQFKISKRGEAGFFKEGTRDIVDISECPLMTEPFNELYRKARSADLSGIRELQITVGDVATAQLQGAPFDEARAEEFVSMGFDGIFFEDGLYRGSGYVTLPLLGMQYTVSPDGFIQANWALSVKIAQMIKSWLSDLERPKILDLYAGAGNFSLPLHEIASRIVAVEENPYSVKDGERNKEINGIKNITYINSRVEKAKLRGSFDAVILDPPRPGLTSAVVSMLIESSTPRIAYLSCNPSTLARDLGKLSEKYEIESVRMIDMFPNTYHIESLAFLRLK